MKKIIFCSFLILFLMVFWQAISHIRIIKHPAAVALVTITIPEGFDLNQIADTLTLKLKNFNKVLFLSKSEKLEGYLFPDTYFFSTNVNEDGVIKAMNSNFEKKINPLISEITSEGKRESDIIIMASLIEKEAEGDIDRKIISGILWKRIKIGMPLEVDAAPETYKIKGLPENPIGNPGLLAIMAAIYPQDAPYLYYLHDKNGMVHYAKTFTEHQANIKKYLK